MRELRPFQRLGVDFLLSRPASLLADDMGTGKTFQALSAASRLGAHEHTPAPLVVICPASVKGVWLAEIALLTRSCRPLWSHTHCVSDRKAFFWPYSTPQGVPATVINYELLPEEPPQAPKPPLPTAAEKRAALLKSSASLFSMEMVARGVGKPVAIPILGPLTKKKPEAPKALCWTCQGAKESVRNCFTCAGMGERPLPQRGTVLVVDEAHRCKGGQSTQAYRRVKALCDAVRFRGGRVFLLSATPLLNRPQELRAVLSLGGLDRQVFPNSNAFLAGYGGSIKTVYAKAGKIETYSFPEPAVAEPWVSERLATVSIRRTKAEVLPELPKKSYQDVVVAIADDELLQALHAELMARGWDGSVTSLAKLDGVGKIAKLRAAIAAAKMKAALDLIADYEESREPFVVFSAHEAPMTDLVAMKTRRGTSSWGLITGKVLADKRPAIVADFQARRLQALAATIGAGGVGITLTTAALALFIDLAWTPALNAQAEDRLCRMGQKRAVSIVRLIADHPIERRLHALLAHKDVTIASTWEVG